MSGVVNELDSINFSIKKASKLVKEIGRQIDAGETPTVSKLYLRVHQTKGSQWVNDKSKDAYDKYVQKLSETQATISTQATLDGSTPPTPSEPSYDEQMKIWIDANGLTKQGRLCGFGPEGDMYSNSQGLCSIQKRGKTYTNTFAALVDENKRQKIELDSQKKVLANVQAKLTSEQAKSKKQTKKVHKYAKATQDIQAQMLQWHSLMKTILPNLPPPIPMIDSLSESEDGEEDENDDDGGGGSDSADE